LSPLFSCVGSRILSVTVAFVDLRECVSVAIMLIVPLI